MFGGIRQVRPGERRDTFVGMVTLFLLMAAHAVLETARDALFLSHIAAEQLPFVYIGVAVAAFGVASLQERGPSGRAALSIWLVVAGATTVAFWPLIGTGDWVLYALYIWSAVVVTVALARVFILLGERFTVTQAKRLYATIGAGSVVGAIAGSGAAGLLATVVDAKQLLVIAGVILIVASAAPPMLSSVAAPASRADRRAVKPNPVTSAKRVVGHPYARRVAALLIVFTLTFTLVDFVFKSEIAASVPREELPVLLARVYFGLNVGSLIVQFFVVQLVIRVAGPTRTLAVLPALLALGGVGVLLGGGLVASIALKGVDGGLRHSLHRTASELLYVPMDKGLRSAAKTFIDIAAHRGGQAASSVVILFLAWVGVPFEWLGLAIAALGALGVGLALELRRHYLDVFRGRLTAAAYHERVDLPELSLESLESLLTALNSPDDQSVKTALDLMAEQDRAHLIPGLILYHPSPEVLTVALGHLATTGRTDFLPLADRLIDHEYADVRAAAIRARMKIAPDEALLRSKLEVSCPVVRTTALVGLTSGGYAKLRETAPHLDAVVEHGSDVAKEALARAIGFGRPLLFDDLLVRLARSDSDEVLVSVARSMGRTPTPSFLPALIRMLPRRRVRDAAMVALVPMGETALSALEGTLADETESTRLRRYVPDAIRRFAPQRAAGILTRQLAEVGHGEVRYRILRALNWLTVEHEGLRLDKDVLRSAMEQALSKAYRLLDWRLVFEAGAERDAARRTDAHELLVKMLNDKETNTKERLFRLLGLLHPKQDLPTIFRGLRSERADVRASSRELIESFVEPRARAALLGLIDELPDRQRLMSSGAFHRPTTRGYEELLRELLESRSESLRCLAVYHIGELKLSSLRPSLEALEAPSQGPLATVVRQAIAALSIDPEPAR